MSLTAILSGRIPVHSSNLSSVGYDAVSGTLTVEFHGGRIYAYFGVPPWIYAGLLAASSHGTYFHEHIKSFYPYRRLA